MKAKEVKITRDDFLAHRSGMLFSDVAIDKRIDFDKWLDFFNRPEIQQRLIDSEIDHNRPALAGVVKELEATDCFDSLLSKYDAHTTRRARQAIGVLVWVIMEQQGFSKTGKKGSLGRRAPLAKPSDKLGAYKNIQGISKWFTKAERYILPVGHPYRR